MSETLISPLETAPQQDLAGAPPTEQLEPAGPEPQAATEPAPDEPTEQEAKSRRQLAAENLKLVGKLAGRVAVGGAKVGGKAVVATARVTSKAAETSARTTGRGARATAKGAKTATVAVGQKAKESSKKNLEKLEKEEAFYSALGDRALVGLGATLERTRVNEIPASRFQRRRAAKVERHIKEHTHKARVDAWREDFFKNTPYHTEVDQDATRLAQTQATRAHNKAYKKGLITGEEYAAKLGEAGGIIITRPDKMMRKLNNRLEKSAQETLDIANPKMAKRVRGARIRLNQMVAGRSETSVEPEADAEAAPAEPGIETVEPATPAVAEGAPLTDFEKLKKLRDAGILPPPSTKETVVAPPAPEVAEKDVMSIAQGILAQVEQAQAGEPDLNKDDLMLELIENALVSPEGAMDSDISNKGLEILDAIHKLEDEASKPQPTEVQAAADTESAELLNQASVELMAETAYIGAQDKVHLQIDAEDRQRRADGKPKLTKEEKAEYWKSEGDIREQLLGDLSPENKSLVDKQISVLIKADKAAYRAGEEKLRDKRRRERREQQAAERKAQPASTSQRSNETVQQRARREREEKAKQKIADGQRTFSHPDIPS